MTRERTAVLTAIGVGLGLIYFVDPKRGPRRRGLMKDTLAQSLNASLTVIDATRRDLTQHAEGVAAHVRRAFRRDVPDNDVLLERVRAQIGVVVSHPHAIRVEVADGCVTLNGPILHHEAKPLLRALARIRGVCSIVNALDEHEKTDLVPALQDGASPRTRRWAPTGRRIFRTTAAT